MNPTSLRHGCLGLAALAAAACGSDEAVGESSPLEPPAPYAAQAQAQPSPGGVVASAEPFAMRVVTDGLAAPWEVSWGPDGLLWITERVGKRVVRVDPSSGARKTALQLRSVYQSSGQDGLLGMALHPQLLKGQNADFVYLAFTYDADTGPDVLRRMKVVRLTYDAKSETLGSTVELLAGLPASNDHNSGRLRFGPDGKLYLTVGDQGRNQFENKCLPVRAQNLPTREDVARASWLLYQGKVLRINLDGSIPGDNPQLAGVRSHVYSYGHRNAQGLAFGPDGTLYASEQGPKTDDELNLIEAGKNYGWPHVAGYLDDKAYVYGNWSAARDCAQLPYDDYTLPSSVPHEPEYAFSHPDFRPPLRTFFTVGDDYNFRNPACRSAPTICWPTIAASSLELYEPGGSAIAGWGRSLLVTSLKLGAVVRVELSADGRSVTGPNVTLFKTTNRYRDLAVAPDRRTFYVITDSQGDTSGPTQGVTQNLAHRGAVLAFRYAP